MKEMTEKEVIERLKVFKTNNTYTYILNIYSKFFNGFIVNVNDTLLLFTDDVLGQIPILIKDIKYVDYSNSNKKKVLNGK